MDIDNIDNMDLESICNPKRKPRMLARDWRVLLLMLVPAVLVWWLVDYEPFFQYMYYPKIAVSFAFLYMMGVSVYAAGLSAFRRPGYARIIFGADALIAISLSLRADQTGWIGICLLFATLPCAVCSLAGQSRREGYGPASFLDAGLRLIGGAFSHLALPFQSAFAHSGKGKKGTGAIVAGLILLIPLAFVVLTLLSSADVYFNEILVRATESINGVWFFKLILTLLTALMLFGGLYAVTHAASKAPRAEISARTPLITAAIPVVALDLIYIVFIYVQFRYLFGGQERAAMEGGYAQYARSGFFQLIYVSLINLCVFGFARKVPASKRLTPALGALIVLTAAILASALWRMALYIGEYGLSRLRLNTLWAMLIIFAAIVMAAIKLFMPKMRVFSILALFTLFSYLAFAMASPDAMIARYNIVGYQNGKIQTLDMEYLSGLSTDAIDAIAEYGKTDADAAHKAIDSILKREPEEWYYRALFTDAEMPDALKNAAPVQPNAAE